MSKRLFYFILALGFLFISSPFALQAKDILGSNQGNVLSGEALPSKGNVLTPDQVYADRAIHQLRECEDFYFIVFNEFNRLDPSTEYERKNFEGGHMRCRKGISPRGIIRQEHFDCSYSVDNFPGSVSTTCPSYAGGGSCYVYSKDIGTCPAPTASYLGGEYYHIIEGEREWDLCIEDSLDNAMLGCRVETIRRGGESIVH